MKEKRKFIIIIFSVVFWIGSLIFLSGTVLAEQLPGTTPNSGVDSRIKAIYSALHDLGYGSDGDGSWGDWGAFWNRIRSASEWIPNGNVTPTDIALGKTFYNGSRTQQTGTAHIPDYALQQYDDFDDYERVHSGGTRGYQGEEGAWTPTSTNVWKDERTGLRF